MLFEGYWLGILFIFIAALSWAGASVFLQYIYEDLDFQSPFLVTYICNSLFLVYLPLWQIWTCLGWTNLSKQYSQHCDADNREIAKTSNIARADNNQSYTHVDVLRIAIIISPFWFAANCLYNYGLLMTSVSSSTIISNLSGSFTLAFSYMAGLEDITYGKVVGLLLCFGGVVMVGLQDSDDSGPTGPGKTILGDVVTILAAMGYGLYTTLIRRYVPDDNGISMQLLLGYIGLVNAIIALPALIVMLVMNYENIALATPTVIGFIVINGFTDNVISDYLWARAVLLTSPTVATIGMSVTIPLAMLSDFLLGNGAPSAMACGGAAVVIVGFVLVNVSNEAWGRTYRQLVSGCWAGAGGGNERFSDDSFNGISPMAVAGLDAAQGQGSDECGGSGLGNRGAGGTRTGGWQQVLSSSNNNNNNSKRCTVDKQAYIAIDTR